MKPLPTLSRLYRALLCAALSLPLSPAHAEAPVAAAAVPVVQPLPAGQTEAGMWSVRIDVAALRAARPGDSVRLALPDGQLLPVVFDALLGGSDGDTWIGHHAAGREYAVRLRLDGALAAGILRSPEGGFVLGHVDGQQLMGRDLSADGVSSPMADLPSMFSPDVADAATDHRDRADAPGQVPADVAHPVTFNLVALSALEPGDEVALSIPDHGDYRVTYDRTDEGASDTSTWVGHLTDYGSEFRVIVSTGPDGSVGNILTPSGELMLIDDGNRQWLVDPVRSGLSQLESDHADSVGIEVAAGGVAEGGTSAAAGTGTSAGAGTSSGAGADASATDIDLMVLYTPGFVRAHGKLAATRIAQLVALANQAYADSAVPIRLRLVASAKVSLADTTPNTSALTALARASGPFRTVPALRRKAGADLVVLVRPFYMNAQGGNCGVGYVGGYNGSNIAAYGNLAYSVVSDGRDRAGSNYYCTDYTFTHELGHNMGLMHDRDTVARQGGGQGSHPYAFGYGRSGSFGSVMSYVSPVVGRFSNPDLNTCGGGAACGVPVDDPAAAHNALALTENRLAVSAWTRATVPAYFQVSGTVSRAGRALANVPISASEGARCTATGRTGAYACTVPWGWSGTIAPEIARTVRPGSIALSNVRKAQPRKNFIVR